MASFKEKLLEQCKATLRRKIELISFSIDEIKSSMENETKSSAGDKHETARARMQSEHEKLVWQLDELKAQAEQLNQVDLKRATEVVSSQNLVITDHGTFFIVVPLGKMELEGQTVYAISSQSPIAKKLLGLKAGEKFGVNDKHYRILEIL